MTGPAENRARFNPAYIGPRPEVEALIPLDAKLVLDVGCSIGTLGASIKKRTGGEVYGVEISSEMAKEAATKIDRVFVGDVESVFLSDALQGLRFNAIVFADILEHLRDPWGVLRAAGRFVLPGGVIVASIPNIRHIDTLFNLVFRGYWPYRDRGIHDRTHLRFFTKRNVIELFEGAGLEIDSVNANYRVIERPHDFNRYAHVFARFGLKEFLAFQYVVSAHFPAPGQI